MISNEELLVMFPRMLSEREARINTLLAQLPEGMKHCTIVLEQCAAGHSHLRGSNWIKHPCLQCRVDDLQKTLSARDLRINELQGFYSAPSLTVETEIAAERRVSEAYRTLMLEMLERVLG